MKIFDTMELIQEYAKVSGKFCLYISFDNRLDYEEVMKAAPYLTQDQAICDGMYILTFDTEDELYKYFDLTIGDDGPTKLNSYNGEARVYAVTINDKGKIETENT